MDSILYELARLQIISIAEKMENIRVRNKDRDEMDIKDIADMLKYSETLLNLKRYTDSFYRWN